MQKKYLFKLTTYLFLITALLIETNLNIFLINSVKPFFILSIVMIILLSIELILYLFTTKTIISTTSFALLANTIAYIIVFANLFPYYKMTNTYGEMYYYTQFIYPGIYTINRNVEYISFSSQGLSITILSLNIYFTWIFLIVDLVLAIIQKKKKKIINLLLKEESN